MRQEKTENIRSFLAQAVRQGEREIVQAAVSHFGITRQAVNRHLASMIAQGILEASGKTRGRIYALKTLVERSTTVAISQHPAEDRVWREHFSALVSKLPENVRTICCHGFTEMFNNAVDHSEGKTITAQLSLTYAAARMTVSDDGIGIFTKIKNALNLANEREAILELTKGKVTTDPARHTGEGIFFTSRMFDSFSISSDRLYLSHMVPDDDWRVADRSVSAGTIVQMEIASGSSRTTREVFDRYTSTLDTPTFDKARVSVALLCMEGESIVSRSQAKRLLTGFDRFKEVVLDFEGVKDIGQAFSDEVFRVFRNQHPGIRINWTRANAQVERMIQRAMHPV